MTIEAGSVVRTPLEIFLTFARIAVTSFGGVNFWIRRVLVEEKGWITDEEYIEGLALGQILPGPNVYNLTVMLGYRFAGLAGAFAAVGGLVGPPLAVVGALGIAYRQLGGLPLVQHALGGMVSVAAGLVLANGFVLARALPRRARPWASLVLAFAGVGMLHWPLLAVMGGLAPVAFALAWRDAAPGKT